MSYHSSPDNIHGLVRHLRHVHPDDLFGTGFRRKHGENSSPTANIKHNLVLEGVFIRVKTVSITYSPHPVLVEIAEISVAWPYDRVPG